MTDNNSIDRDASMSGAEDPKGARDAVLHVLWRRKWGILLCMAIAFVLGLGYLVVAKPMYLSTTQIFARETGDMMSTGGGDGANNSAFSFRMLNVIKSTPILAKTISRDEVKSLRTIKEAPDGFGYLDGHVIADVDRNTNIIAISAESPYPEDAAKIVNSVRNAFMDFEKNQGQHSVTEILLILRDERNKAEEELKTKTEKVIQFRREKLVSPDGEKSNISMQRLQSLSEALTKAQLETFEAKNTYDDALTALNKDPEKMQLLMQMQQDTSVRVNDTVQIETLRQEMTKWQTELQQVQTQFLPNHPRVRTYQRRVDQLNVAYAAALGRRYKSMQAREAELQSVFEKQQKEAINRSADTEEFKQLQAGVDRANRTLDLLETRIKELDVTKQGSSIKIDIVDEGQVPLKAYRPDRKKTLGIALVLGLMMGVTLALVRDWADPRLHSAEDVKAALGLPVLGQIPRMPAGLAPSVMGQQILVDPASDVAEACRSLRTAIQFGVPAGRAKTILMASPAEGDGKSTAASNLAIAFAQAGKRVLIMDADLRQPVQHDTFGVEDETGLSDVLAEEKSASQAIQQTAVANLDILPCGPMPENPAELLNSQAFIDLLDELSEKYDHIIIDSPPVVAVTDARIIAASCDVTLLVLRADSSNRRLAEASRDGLISVGGQLLGIVLNGVATGTAESHYGSRGKRGGSASREGLLAAGMADNESHRNGAGPVVSIDTMRKMSPASGQTRAGSTPSTPETKAS